MKFTTLTGRSRYINIRKDAIDWDAPSRSKIQDFFRQYWENNVCYEEMKMAGSRMRLDLVNMTKYIAIEVHGKQHESYCPFFHKSRQDYLDQIKRDDLKREWCNINNIKLIEIYEDDIPHLSKKWVNETFKINLI